MNYTPTLDTQKRQIRLEMPSMPSEEVTDENYAQVLKYYLDEINTYGKDEEFLNNERFKLYKENNKITERFEKLKITHDEKLIAITKNYNVKVQQDLYKITLVRDQFDKFLEENKETLKWADQCIAPPPKFSAGWEKELIWVYEDCGYSSSYERDKLPPNCTFWGGRYGWPNYLENNKDCLSIETAKTAGIRSMHDVCDVIGIAKTFDCAIKKVLSKYSCKSKLQPLKISTTLNNENVTIKVDSVFEEMILPYFNKVQELTTQVEQMKENNNYLRKQLDNTKDESFQKIESYRVHLYTEYSKRLDFLGNNIKTHQFYFKHLRKDFSEITCPYQKAHFQGAIEEYFRIQSKMTEYKFVNKSAENFKKEAGK